MNEFFLLIALVKDRYPNEAQNMAISKLAQAVSDWTTRPDHVESYISFGKMRQEIADLWLYTIWVPRELFDTPIGLDRMRDLNMLSIFFDRQREP